MQRAAEAERRRAAGVGRPHRRALPRRVEAPRHHQRRLHPHHRAPPLRRGRQSCSSGSTTTATSSKGTYEGLYCVACEAYYTEADLGRRASHLPDPRPPGRARQRGELLLRAVAASSSRSSTGTRPTRTSSSPRASATRRSGSSAAGSQDFSISRTSISWGVPIPWDPEPRHLRLVRRPHQLRHRGRLRRRPRAVRGVVAGRPPPHRQGHPPVPLRVLAGDAAGCRARAAAADLRPRLPARRRREDEQDPAQPDRAGRPRRGLRRRRVPLPLPARRPLRARRRLQLRADGRPVQRRPRQQPRQPPRPASPRSSPRSAMASVPRPVPTARSPPSPPRPTTRPRRRPGPTCSRRSRSRRRGASSARRTPTSRPTSRGRPSPDPTSTPCSATPSRCCASSPSSPARPSRRRRPRCGAASACPARPEDQRLPDAAAWGGYPGGLPVEKGTPLFPRFNPVSPASA